MWGAEEEEEEDEDEDEKVAETGSKEEYRGG